MDYKLISDPRTKMFKLVKIGSGLKKSNLLYGMWIFRPVQLDVIWISFGVSIENICISLFTFQGIWGSWMGQVGMGMGMGCGDSSTGWGVFWEGIYTLIV